MSLADTPSDVTLTVAAEKLTAGCNSPPFICEESILDTHSKLLRKPFNQKLSITYQLKTFDGKPFDTKNFDKVSKIPFDGPTEKLSKEPYGHTLEIPIKISILENFLTNFLNF